MIEPHAHSVDQKTDEEELEAHFQDCFGNEEEIMLIGIHKGIRIQVRGPMGDDGNPGTEIHEDHIKSRIYHPGQGGIPVHFSLIHEAHIVHHHQDRNEVMENVVIKREMLIADIIEPMGPNGPWPDNEMIHEGQGSQAGGYDVATICGVKKWHVHP